MAHRPLWLWLTWLATGPGAACSLQAHSLEARSSEDGASETGAEPTESPSHALARRGRELFVQGELAAGSEQLEAALAAAANDAERLEALRWLAHGRARAGDPEGAAVRLLEALALQPGDPWLHYALGSARYTQGACEPAIAAWTAALALDPGHVKSLQWRAHARRLAGELQAAREDLTRALGLLERAAPEAFKAWGGDRNELIRTTLNERAQVLDELGHPRAAAADRARAGGPGGATSP